MTMTDDHDNEFDDVVLAVPEEQPPAERSFGQRVRARLRRELSDALIDPAVQPDGDFGLNGSRIALQDADRLASFNGLITAMRLSTTVLTLLFVMTSDNTDSIVLRYSFAAVVAYAIFRSVRPLKYQENTRSLLRVIGEVFLHVIAVTITGGWESPLLFTIVTAISIAGFARGFAFSLRIAIVICLAISYPYVQGAAETRDAVASSGLWSAVILFFALVSGYVRRISGEADRERALAFDRLGRLSDANTLLHSLHRVTQTLPASLDLGDVLDSTHSRLKGLISFDSIAIMVFDETDAEWEVVRHQGLHAPRRLGPTSLPVGLKRAITENKLISIDNLAEVNCTGLSKRAGSGLYSVLSARGSIIGLIALEHTDFAHFTVRDAEVLEGFAAPAALSIDNARWFARLRTVGADEERTRIARDLHDRIGQSLAYLAFELDRIVEKDEVGDPISEPIKQLREDVRGVIREVRDTLYDLRTDVSETQSLAVVLEQYAARVADRARISIQVDAEDGHRLPVLQEREMWRVAQEALANVERHAQATAVRVVWRCDGERALIDVTDNGVGFEQGRAGRLDSYGVVGMRERASSIGATLEIVSAPGRGTRVRCSLNPNGGSTTASQKPVVQRSSS